VVWEAGKEPWRALEWWEEQVDGQGQVVRREQVGVREAAYGPGQTQVWSGEQHATIKACRAEYWRRHRLVGGRGG
jgi:hypothetical protein